MSSLKITEALESIAERSAGVLRPEDVVEAARDPRSVLHDHFDWNDTVAAHNWRIQQARRLIRITVAYCEQVQQHVRVFVSLTPDRTADGGGYRTLATVLSSKTTRAQLLADAMFELKTFENKYRMLSELANVFDAIRDTRLALERKTTRKAGKAAARRAKARTG